MDISGTKNNTTIDGSVAQHQASSIAKLDALLRHARAAIPNSPAPTAEVKARIIATVELTPKTIADLIAKLPADTPIVKNLTEISKTPTNNQHVLAKLGIHNNAAATSNGLSITQNNSFSKATTWALIDRKLSAQQTILLKWGQNSLEYLLQTNKPSPSASNITERTAQNLGLQYSALLTQSKLNAAIEINATVKSENNTLYSNHTKSIIETALRQALPNQDTHFTLLKNVIKTSNSESNTYIQNALRTKNPIVRQLAQSLTQIDNWKNSIPELPKITAAQVRQALSQSGIFFESNIKQSGAITQPTLAAPPRLQAPLNPQTLFTNDTADQKTKKQTSAPDLKHTLLALTALTPQLTTANLLNSTIKNTTLIDTFLHLFFHRTLGRNPQDYPKARANQQQNLVQLEKLVSETLAKVSSQQLSTLQAATSDTQTSHQVHTDLLFKLHDQLVPVNTRIFRDEKNEDDDSNTKTSRSWRFVLEWSFESFGRFNAEIHLHDRRLKYTLWAENPDIRKRMKQNAMSLIDDLNTQDIHVDNIKVVDMPIAHEFRTQSSSTLIDVRT